MLRAPPPALDSMPNLAPSSRTQRQLGAYFAVLMLTLGLAEPTGLVSLPLLFWLKDGLGLRPQAIAAFEAVALAPLYFGFVFGFVRDRWRPFVSAGEAVRPLLNFSRNRVIRRLKHARRVGRCS